MRMRITDVRWSRLHACAQDATHLRMRQQESRACEKQYALFLSLTPRSARLVSFPDPAPLRGKEGLGTLVDFLGISNHVTHAYAHAHFSNKRVIRELRIVSCPGGGVWVAVTREFERDNCVISEILQSDWTIPNRAGVPRKSTKVLSACGRGRLGTRLQLVM